MGYHKPKRTLMVAVVGTYKNGYVKLDKDYTTKEPVKVIITFLEDVKETSEKGIALTDFSFQKSQKNLKDVKSSFGDTVTEERRTAL